MGFFCSEVNICDLDRLFSLDSHLLILLSNFAKMLTMESQKPG